MKKSEMTKLHVEAIEMNEMYNAHVEALFMNEQRNIVYSRKEFNAFKRQSTYAESIKLSAFTFSKNINSQCYKLETLMSEFHSETALQTLMKKIYDEDVTIARIKSHISHLKLKFQNVVKYEERASEANKHVTEFRFTLK